MRGGRSIGLIAITLLVAGLLEPSWQWFVGRFLDSASTDPHGMGGAFERVGKMISPIQQLLFGAASGMLIALAIGYWAQIREFPARAMVFIFGLGKDDSLEDIPEQLVFRKVSIARYSDTRKRKKYLSFRLYVQNCTKANLSNCSIWLRAANAKPFNVTIPVGNSYKPFNLCRYERLDFEVFSIPVNENSYQVLVPAKTTASLSCARDGEETEIRFLLERPVKFEFMLSAAGRDSVPLILHLFVDAAGKCRLEETV
jgi:hypothetical protein